MKNLSRALRVPFMIAVAVLMSFSVSSAQAPGYGPPPGPGPGGRWVFLGSAHVDGAADHDKIRCPGRSRYRAIQLHVVGGGIRFDHVVIVYGNHQSQPLYIRNFIRGGGTTRVIDLPGAWRDIEYVELWYEKAHWQQRPEVQLYGMQ